MIFLIFIPKYEREAAFHFVKPLSEIIVMITLLYKLIFYNIMSGSIFKYHIVDNAWTFSN